MMSLVQTILKCACTMAYTLINQSWNNFGQSLTRTVELVVVQGRST